MNKTPKVSRLSIAKAIESVLETGARSATVYQHPKLTVTATRRHHPNRRHRSTQLLVTIGAPNSRSRKFIKNLIAAKEPFPVKRVILSLYRDTTL